MTSQRPRRMTITELARRLGLSPATVSNAYNRPDQINAKTRERVLKVASQLGFNGPDPLARGLRRRRVGAVGLLYGERLSHAVADPAQSLFLQGLTASLESAGLSLLLLPGRPDFNVALAFATNAVVDGFVLYSIGGSDPIRRAILNRGMPTVMVDGPGETLITVDDVLGGRLAAEHVLQLGHRSIGVISDRFDSAEGPGEDGIVTLAAQPSDIHQPNLRRLRGYRRAFKAAGIDLKTVPVIQADATTETAGAEALRKLIVHFRSVTAVLCVTDRLALGGLRAAQALGLRVPRDLSFVGFDDIPAAAHSTPSLTTVHQDHAGKGHAAGEALIKLLAGRPTATFTSLPVSLKARSTTGPASTAWR
jgi:DNA-binding LacI/PurR family transcriptional regulator